MPALIYAAKVVRTPYVTPAGPDAYNLAVSGNAATGVPAGTLVHDKGVPRREEGAGEGGDHDRVVNVRQQPDARIRVDDRDGGVDGLAVVDLQRDGVRSRREAGGDGHINVDNAAAVGAYRDALARDRHDDLGVRDRDAHEAAPAPDARASLRSRVRRLEGNGG